MRALTLLLALTTAATAQKVRDTHASLLDVPTRQVFLAQTKSPLVLEAIRRLPSCVSTPAIPAPPTPMEIPHHYLNGSSGPINPAEREATELYNRFTIRVTGGMNRWLATGSEPEAQCALAQLDAWAQARALTDYDQHNYSQSWFQAGWTFCSSGVTASILAQDKTLDPTQQARVAAWLNKAAHQLISYDDKASGNNLHDWRALAATSIGILTSDEKLFHYGTEAFKSAVSGINADGSLPAEMQRHENAIHYQGFALQPLILIAEFATRQGIDLYAFSANGHTLRDAILFYGRALDDPSLVKPYTADPQHLGTSNDSVAPEVFYIARFGAKDLPPALTQGITAKTGASNIGGSTIILAANDRDTFK